MGTFADYELRPFGDGAFVIQAVWRDREALMAARDPDTPPPALALLDKVGASHSHDVLTVDEEYAT